MQLFLHMVQLEGTKESVSAFLFVFCFLILPFPVVSFNQTRQFTSLGLVPQFF